MEKNIIFNEDCVGEKGMCIIPDKSIDLILCDLPYAVTDCKWDTVIPYDLLWEQYHRIIKEKGAIVLTAIQPFTTKLIMSNMRQFRYCWYWKKNAPTGFAFAKYQPMRIIEDILVFYKKAPKYNPQGLKKIEPKVKLRRNSGKDCIYKSSTLSKEHIVEYSNYPKNILEFKKDRGLHPTQKPVALFEYLIKTYTDKGDTVLDNCIGSGTTAIACINTERKFIGFEKDKEYFRIATNRIREHAKKKGTVTAV